MTALWYIQVSLLCLPLWVLKRGFNAELMKPHFKHFSPPSSVINITDQIALQWKVFLWVSPPSSRSNKLPCLALAQWLSCSLYYILIRHNFTLSHLCLLPSDYIWNHSTLPQQIRCQYHLSFMHTRTTLASAGESISSIKHSIKLLDETQDGSDLHKHFQLCYSHSSELTSQYNRPTSHGQHSSTLWAVL